MITTTAVTTTTMTSTTTTTGILSDLLLGERSEIRGKSAIYYNINDVDNRTSNYDQKAFRYRCVFIFQLLSVSQSIPITKWFRLCFPKSNTENSLQGVQKSNGNVGIELDSQQNVVSFVEHHPPVAYRCVD